jgi:hypothetical protein
MMIRLYGIHIYVTTYNNSKLYTIRYKLTKYCIVDYNISP